MVQKKYILLVIRGLVYQLLFLLTILYILIFRFIFFGPGVILKLLTFKIVKWFLDKQNLYTNGGKQQLTKQVF